MVLFSKTRRARIGAVGARLPLLVACQVTSRASQSSQGAQGNGVSSDSAISDDGRFVAFWSPATNLVPLDSNGVTDVFVRNRQSKTTTRVSDVFVRDRGAASTASTG